MAQLNLAERARRLLARNLWIRPAVASAFSIAMAAGAYVFGRSYDGRFDFDIDEPSLASLFTIFASSMLTVATFTVSAIVTAASSASNSTTPRAARLVLGDSKAQIVLSAFIAAFIYSILSILALKLLNYGNAGRFVLFTGLLAIVAFVLVSFINWVDHAMKLGRHDNIIDRLSEAALNLMRPEHVGTWGAVAYDGAAPAAALGIAAPCVGYVSELDLQGLQDIAEDFGGAVYLTVRPGDFVDARQPFAYLTPVSDAAREHEANVREAIDVGSTREFDTDVRFGLVNLAETADRALSAGINDPGTAIAVLGRQLQVITRWADVSAEGECNEVRFDRVYMPPLAADEIVRDCFTPIARDGAAAVEVGIRLQKTLAAVVRLNRPDMTRAALEMSETALTLAEATLVAEPHKARVRKAAEEVRRLAEAPDEGEQDLTAAAGVSF